MKKGIFSIILFFIVKTIIAQIGVGEWRDHLPFNYAIDVTQSSKKIYIASEYGVFSYNKSTHSIEKFTKVNKLSDVGISAIEYSSNNKVLFIGYSNGNLDMIFDNEVFNLSDIKREMIIGSKSINHILFVDNYAYLSCGFGIVVVNVTKKEIKDTYYIGDLGSFIQVNQLFVNNDYIYAATAQGIYVADINSQNLSDYSNWQRITSIPNYTASFNSLYVSDDYILANQNNESSNDILYSYSTSSGFWETFHNEFNDIRNISYNNSIISVVTNEEILLYNTNLISQGTISKSNIPSLNPSDAIIDSDNIYWIADRGYGLNRYKNNSYEYIYPNAPYFASCYKITTVKDKVFVTGGGLSPQLNNMYYHGVVHIFENENWGSYINYDAVDYMSVAVDPRNDDHYFATTWMNGVVEYNKNIIQNTYTDVNSPIQTAVPGDDYFFTSGITFDKENTMWITNTFVEYPVLARKTNGDWAQFRFDEKISNIRVGDIIITKNDHKWVTLPNGNGLFVFDDNNTIDNENDDLTKKLNIIDNNGKLITNHVFSIAEDLEVFRIFRHLRDPGRNARTSGSRCNRS